MKNGIYVGLWVKCAIVFFIGSNSFANTLHYSGTSLETKWEVTAAGFDAKAGSHLLIEKLASEIAMGQYKTLLLATSSFNSPILSTAICSSLNAPNGLESVQLFIDAKLASISALKQLSECSNKIDIVSIGDSEAKNIDVLLNLNIAVLVNHHAKADSLVIGLSGALNENIMADSFENWLFLKDQFHSAVIQHPLCAIQSLSKKDSLFTFAKSYSQCSELIATQGGTQIWFKTTPTSACQSGSHDKVCVRSRSMDSFTRAVIGKAKNELKITMNHFSHPDRMMRLIDKLGSTTKVTFLNNDNLLRSRKGILKETAVSQIDVKAHTYLEEFGANQLYIDQSEGLKPINGRWIQVDATYLVKSSSDLADLGNSSKLEYSIEHFFVIKDPGINSAYTEIWEALKTTAKKESELPLGELPEASNIKNEVKLVKDMILFLGIMGESLKGAPAIRLVH